VCTTLWAPYPHGITGVNRRVACQITRFLKAQLRETDLGAWLGRAPRKQGDA
jgi:hypothetical protein